jgi:subtilisin-like proprotein convertase family protein
LGKDLAVKLEIIANNDALIYLDASTDPYSNSDKGADNANGATWNLELQRTLTSTIGNSAYDIGHMVSGSGGGGNAGCIGCICVNPSNNDAYAKGSAWSAPSNNIPSGSRFDIDVFAHEIGHQLGGSHTFSFKQEGGGFNVEPGSGTTIMAYAGVVSPSNLNVQFFSDDYFSVRSIMQIQANLSSKSCASNTSLSNSPPIVNAGLEYTIPKGTAFILKGTGTDADGDAITYTWEQNDTAITATDANSFCFPTKVDGPLFRSIKPSNSPIRYMPNQIDVLSNVLSSRWESVSDIERTLNFILTGRDNAETSTSQTNSDTKKVNVSGAVGPFVVTSQNVDFIGWQSGTIQNITWAVNGVETLPGSSNVNIKLSTDGGLTFPISLATNIPNNGSTNILVPNLSETNCRILIEPTNNIFYAVNSKVFAIGYSVTQECKTYPFSTPISIPDNVLTYTSTTINVPSLRSIIQDVNVSISIEHASMPDIQIELAAPTGTRTILQRSQCGTNLNLNYDDSGNTLDCALTTLQNVKPNRALSVFNGENPSNTWTLRLRDVSPGDVGTLKSASVTICSLSYTPLDINNFNLSNFTVYPNPNNGNFKIQFSSQSENDVMISVHDLLGRKVFENKYNKTSSEFNENIQLKNVSSGVYLLTIVDGDSKEEKKIIIE